MDTAEPSVEMTSTSARIKSNRKLAWVIAGVILLIPFIAMQFTEEVNWSVFDFIVMGALMASGILAYRALTSEPRPKAYKIAAGLAILASFLMIWINGAVGIIGSENNDINMLFTGVLGVGLVGALLSVFKPRGMAIAMMATAAAQVLVFLVAWIGGWGFTGPITIVFTAIWLTSARLFQQAAAQGDNTEAVTS